jgi:hypothetical protein
VYAPQPCGGSQELGTGEAVIVIEGVSEGKLEGVDVAVGIGVGVRARVWVGFGEVVIISTLSNVG